MLSCGKRDRMKKTMGIEVFSLSSTLEQEIKRLFSVYRNNTDQIFYERLSPVPGAVLLKKEFDSELDDFQAAVMKRLSQEFPL